MRFSGMQFKKKHQSLVLLATLVSINTAVLAEEGKEGVDSLKEVVISATRIEQDVLDVASTVTTVSGEDVEKQMPTDIKDLLRYEAGVSIRSQPNRASGVFRATGRAGNEGINIRGLEGNRVLLQVDGVRLPSAYIDGGPYAAGRGDYIDVEAFKRVEVLRGSSSTQYGSDGLAGAVSFLTRDPEDLLTLGNPWQAAMKVGYSSLDNSWVTVPSIAYADDLVEAMFLASIRYGDETQNMGDNHAHNTTRTAPNPQDTHSEFFLAKLVLKPHENHQVKFTVENHNRHVDTNVLTFFGDPFTSTTLTDVRLKEDIKRQLYKVDYDYSNGENPWLQHAKLSLYKQDSENRQFGRERRASAVRTERVRDTDYTEDTIGGSLQLESSFGDAISHHFVYGVDASVAEVSSVRDGYNIGDAAFVKAKNFPDTDYKLLGTFVQDEISIGQFSIIPGLRYDRFELKPHVDDLYLASTAVPATKLKGSKVSPKLGAIWKLDPLANIFAQYAHGFRAPQPFQVNNGFENLTPAFGSPYTTIGNPNLKPETSKSIEVGIRGRNNTFRYSASVFNGRYKDFIASGQDVGEIAGVTQFQSINFGEVEISGFELSGEWAFSESWSTSASFAHTKGDSKENGVKAPLISIDPDKLVLGLRYDKNRQYGAQLFATLVERKKRNPDPSSNYTPEGYAVFDLMGYYNFNERVSINAGVYNIFDRKYFAWADVRGLSPTSGQVDAFSQPGRNASISVKYQF